MTSGRAFLARSGAAGVAVAASPALGAESMVEQDVTTTTAAARPTCRSKKGAPVYDEAQVEQRAWAKLPALYRTALA